MSAPPGSPDHSNQAIILDNLPPEVEEQLFLRARENGTNPGIEAAKIIEEHLFGEDGAGGLL